MLSGHNKQTVDTQSIAAEFHHFYGALYIIGPMPVGSAGEGQEGRIREHLKAYGLPLEALEEMAQPITIEELNAVVATLSKGKSPGPDGFTNTYYKKFWPMLSSPLCKYFNSITACNPLPPEALLEYATVLPKAGKDPQLCANYRPIPFLNSDTKMLAKILSLQLQDHIARLGNPDQTGFMKGREARDNTIRALHVLHWVQNGPDQTQSVIINGC